MAYIADQTSQVIPGQPLVERRRCKGRYSCGWYGRNFSCRTPNQLDLVAFNLRVGGDYSDTFVATFVEMNARFVWQSRNHTLPESSPEEAYVLIALQSGVRPGGSPLRPLRVNRWSPNMDALGPCAARSHSSLLAIAHGHYEPHRNVQMPQGQGAGAASLG